ncbi:hypothetical protein TI05_09405, partial [Achromatium sp. WMS3]
FINVGDLLYFRIRDDGYIKPTNNLREIPESVDLTVRAAYILQQQTNCPLGVDIYLNKLLPLGSGLGGGSSDAATTLVALNRLWQLGLTTRELLQLGLELGADVPVFINGTAAWGEGIGEQLTPIILPELWYIVLVPQCQVSTKKIFTDPGLTSHKTSITIDDFIAGAIENDCLSIVQKNYPQVAKALEWLGTKGRLTGTGSCVFAQMDSQYKAEQVVQKLPKDLSGFIAQGQNRSPLYS